MANKHMGKISLVTDDTGADLLEALPYVDIDTDLQEIDHINPKWWTAGKVHALRATQEPCIHIDGDVFFMNKKSKKKIDCDWDALVQMREVGEHYYSTYPDVFSHLSRVWPHISNINLFNFAYNTGIIGFKNEELKGKYVDAYFSLLEQLDTAGAEFPANADPNVAVEQCLLTSVTQRANVYVKELISLDDMDESDLFGAAENVGFVHLWGNSKYQNYYINKVKTRLRSESKRVFNHVEKKIQQL